MPLCLAILLTCWNKPKSIMCNGRKHEYPQPSVSEEENREEYTGVAYRQIS
jgi:hypothetical protein